ncbi:MAG: glycosyl hydrolase [Geminicoccaceae bacterium]
MRIDRPAKIGIGAWEEGPPGWAANRVGALGVAWHYVWGPRPLTSNGHGPLSEFVPMIWGAVQLRDNPKALTDISASEATALLGFNEPDRADQAEMTVEDAVAHWPHLVATRKRLGSPAPSKGEALPAVSWLARFMDATSAAGLRVDFVAVHYYAPTHDLAAFRRYLERVHRAYQRPIWVTEWALVDPETWKDGLARYSLDDTACFFRAGTAMLDDLNFVERHAWFAAFDGGDGWHLNSHAIAADGSLTPVGRAFVDAMGAAPDDKLREIQAW